MKSVHNFKTVDHDYYVRLELFNYALIVAVIVPHIQSPQFVTSQRQIIKIKNAERVLDKKNFLFGRQIIRGFLQGVYSALTPGLLIISAFVYFKGL